VLLSYCPWRTGATDGWSGTTGVITWLLASPDGTPLVSGTGNAPHAAPPQPLTHPFAPHPPHPRPVRPQITTPEMSVDNRKPYVDEAGAVHWPMLLFYPEGMQQDVVEDACEEDTFAQHLDVVGGDQRHWPAGLAEQAPGWLLLLLTRPTPSGTQRDALYEQRCAITCHTCQQHEPCCALGSPTCPPTQCAFAHPMPEVLPGDHTLPPFLQMFSPDAPPLEWDFDNEYTRQRVELYYLSHAGTPLERVSRRAGGAMLYTQADLQETGQLLANRSTWQVP
jgi:hypothetical protein